MNANTIYEFPSVDRYPSKYIELTKNTKCKTREVNFSFKYEELVPIKIDYSCFIKNREEIINMLNNGNYDGILALIRNVQYVNSDYSNYSCNILYDDCVIKSKSLESKHNNSNETKCEIYTKLSNYCYFNKDIELLKLLIVKANRDFSFFPISYLNGYAFDYENQYMFEIFIENIKYSKTKIANIINNIIACNNNAIIFLEIMKKNDHHITINHIKDAIVRNEINIVQYVIINNYDVQNAVDTLYDDDKSENKDKYSFVVKKLTSCNVQMLKCLLDNNINLKPSVVNILLNCVEEKNLDSVMFLIETFSDLDLNLALDKACEKNIDILTYLIKCGANINELFFGTVLNAKSNTFKFLIECGYVAAHIVLDIHLKNVFVNDDHLDNVNYLIKHGANIKYLSTYEEISTTYNNYNTTKYNMEVNDNWDGVKSPLEFIITANKIMHLEFLFDNYFDVIKPHINRLFIIACANGRISIAEYLLDYGAKLSCKALVSACFFGHFETVILLLKRGLKFEDISDNLFNMIVNGKLCAIHDFRRYITPSISSSLNHYYQLTENNDTFRNDIYHYGNDHVNILKLLISYDTKQLGNRILDLGQLTAEFYDIDIFKYFMDDVMFFSNVKCVIASQFNEQEERTLLESSIAYEKLDLIEYLLQKGAKGPITNYNVLYKLKHSQDLSQQIMNVLMKYEIRIFDVDQYNYDKNIDY